MALTGNLTGTLSASMSAEGGVNGQINFDGLGTDNYNELDNKPSINGVVLEGNKTSSDLHINNEGTDNYNELLNKPRINGTTLTGDVSDTQLQINYNHLINKPNIPDITELENRVDTVENDITDINNDINDISDDVATLKASDLVQNSDISSLKNRVTSTETNISNLSSRVSNTESSITYHTSQISNIESDITDINSDIDSLDTRVETTESNISNLEGIVGDGQQTVGTDLTDAVTQLNSSLTNTNITTVLVTTSGAFSANTTRTFNLTENFNNFVYLIISWEQFSNVRETIIVPTTYFNTTNNSRRPQLYDGLLKTQITVYKNTNTSIAVIVETNISDAYHVKVYGCMRIAN